MVRVAGGDLATRLPVSVRGDEIDALSALVNTMMGETERLIGELKSIGDNLAHDLRTPLNHLRGHLYRALELWGEESPDAQRERLERALAAADALRARFDALERVAQIEQDKRRAGFAAFAPDLLVRELGDIYGPVAEDKGSALVVAAVTVAPVVGDRDLMAEAIANLLDNALKFTPAGGIVTLRLTPGPCIEVRDTGPGIPPSDRPLVTARFGRGAHSNGVPGSGLGLAIVAAIARLHGLVFELDGAEPGLVARLRP